MDQAILTYLSEQQSSRQWKAFLTLFATELAEQLAPKNLHGIMRRTGMRFAQQRPLPPAQTVAEIEQAMNTVWRDTGWGWLRIEEAEDSLVLRHFCAPLRANFGEEHQAWTPAFLEGAYEHWLRQSGADEHLRVRQAGAPDGLGSIEYRFGK
ncbi:cellulose biosynthesis protein BcsD [Orrella sp. JC864]|uniref:cellulose biosynthesis protein BcsD n=1 Tax=Orrella sp. JC864 TaxID=3120298 RepID=UPI003008CBC0